MGKLRRFIMGGASYRQIGRAEHLRQMFKKERDVLQKRVSRHRPGTAAHTLASTDLQNWTNQNDHIFQPLNQIAHAEEIGDKTKKDRKNPARRYRTFFQHSPAAEQELVNATLHFHNRGIFPSAEEAVYEHIGKGNHIRTLLEAQNRNVNAADLNAGEQHPPQNDGFHVWRDNIRAQYPYDRHVPGDLELRMTDVHPKDGKLLAGKADYLEQFGRYHRKDKHGNNVAVNEVPQTNAQPTFYVPNTIPGHGIRKFTKGSAEAKAHMARLRAMRKRK